MRLQRAGIRNPSVNRTLRIAAVDASIGRRATLGRTAGNGRIAGVECCCHKGAESARSRHRPKPQRKSRWGGKRTSKALPPEVTQGLPGCQNQDRGVARSRMASATSIGETAGSLVASTKLLSRGVTSTQSIGASSRTGTGHSGRRVGICICAFETQSSTPAWLLSRSWSSKSRQQVSLVRVREAPIFAGDRLAGAPSNSQDVVRRTAEACAHCRLD